MSGDRPRLLFDLGTYPLSETGIGGIGLRAAELADVLDRWFRVRLMVEDPAAAVPAGYVDVVPAGDWQTLLREADAVFFFDMPDRGRIEDAVAGRKLIVSENAPPIEHLEYPSLVRSGDAAARHAGFVRGFTRQLEVSHHFLVRSDVERAVLMGCLCAAGRLTPADAARSATLSHLVSLVPIGFSRRSAAAAARARPRPVADVLWTGGLWSCYEPLALLDAVALCRADGVPVTVGFLYAKPSDDTHDLLHAMHRRIADLHIADLVTLHDEPLAHSDRDGPVKAARALICVARPGAENQTCVRLRIRDSRLYGVPMIVDPFGATGTELTRDGHGIVLADITAGTISRALAGVVRAGTATGRRADPTYSYEKTTAPFATWLRKVLAG